MNISAWAIRSPIAPILAFIILVVLGLQSFSSLPVTRFPNIDVPIVAVTVAQDGAAPGEMEQQITQEVEDAVAGIPGIEDLISTVTDGQSRTVIRFEMNVPTDRAVQDVKDRIDRIRTNLPADIETPIVNRVDVEGQAILTYAVSDPALTLAELSRLVDDTIRRALQGQSGVGQVDRFGGADREVQVTLDPVRLDGFGITAAEVSDQLAASNADLGGGRAELAGGEQTIRALGDAGDVAQLAATMIALPTGGFVRLRDLGHVEDTHAELRSFSKIDGQPVVTFSVFRAQGASEVSVDRTVETTLARIEAEHPTLRIVKVDDMVDYTYSNYETALHTLVEGAVLAVLVVLAFLRNWRATAIAAVALPLSAIPTFWAMDLLGFSLNLVSFLAITLATGILVDDAIVEVENIARHMRMGKTPYRAAIDAADEIGLAVIATTLTIVAVFAPVSFMPGIPGQYFRQFGLTVAIAVLFSLLVARLITPMMAAYLMRPSDSHAEAERDGPIMRAYLRTIHVTLRWRYSTMIGAVGVLLVSVHFMLQIPGSFMPPEDVGRIPISVELPPGSALADTEAATDRITDDIAAVDGVRAVFVLGGSSPTGDLAVRRASVTVLLDPLADGLMDRLYRLVPGLPHLLPVPDGRLRPQAAIETEIFARIARIPDLRAFKLNDRGERDVSFSVLAEDQDSLNEAVARLEAALRAEPALADVASEGALPRPEVHIRPRPDEAARLGVTASAIAQTVRVATLGDFDARLAEISLDDRQVPIRLRLPDAVRGDLAALAALRVPARSGSVPLNTVADIAVGQGPAEVDRFDRQRRAVIGANLPEGVALGTATERFRAVAQAVDLPPGVRLLEAGDAEVQADLQQSFVNAMIMGLMLVLAVLILLFRSVVQPLTILLSLPLAVGGVAAALILTGSALSMPVLIGILMLMGIVTKNAILLIDFAIEMKAAGMDRLKAVMEAGHKRARPIVMTSIAMSAGMLPSALGVGAGGSFRSPMAVAVIGGIIMSTVLSLVVVPSFFLIMDDLSRLLTRIFAPIIGPREEEPEDDLRARMTALEGRLPPED
ncbi:efflux RND transporter permease subunit [Falsirhodobacter algicola]|uniref:MMPL family transporter n=1 Tax=Falsirhodobacter algicola TaxID=2692330 RepID=A0A8J8MSU8_9RHOB|nr:efflux RND transporter permease subunit [Falsirhodobacter algicola]QUS35678.1 MMPL family transporter [Falsirhodobacter algicola]